MLLFAIKVYQYLISPLKPQTCRFYPTCSAYAIDALKKYSVNKAIILIVKRVAKCHPFHSGGYDPLP